MYVLKGNKVYMMKSQGNMGKKHGTDEICADKCLCPGTVPGYYLQRECPYPGTMLRFLYGHH